MKIKLNKEECIGCGTCSTLCPDFWEMNDQEMKVDLKGAKKNEATDEWELEVNDIGCNQEAVECCPVECIKLDP